MSTLERFGSAERHGAADAAQPYWLSGLARRAAWSLGKVVLLVALTGVALGWASMMVRSSGTNQAGRAPPDAWVEVNRPIHLYGLAGTEFARMTSTYTARRHAAGGGREDVLSFGSLDGRDEPFLRLSIYRIGSEAGPPLPLKAELDRMGRQSGMVLVSSGAQAALATRFGPFEGADVRLQSVSIAAPCLGFGSAPSNDAVLRIAGFVCGSAGKPIGRDTLGCVIDRIDLDSAGEDTALQHVFVVAERHRGSDCAPSGLTAAGAKTTWLDVNGGLHELKGALGQSGNPRTARAGSTTLR